MSKRGPVLIAKSRDRTPDHLFHATLRDSETKTVIARRVLCEIYIPDSHRGKVDIVFHPTPNQIPALQFVPAVSLYGRSRAGRFVVKSHEIWHEGATTGVQDGISFMYSCAGSASTLEITNLRRKIEKRHIDSGRILADRMRPHQHGYFHPSLVHWQRQSQTDCEAEIHAPQWSSTNLPETLHSRSRYREENRATCC